MATKRAGSREVKSRFSAYLARAEKGETTIITRRGKPIARLVPETLEEEKPDLEAIEGLRKALKRHLARPSQHGGAPSSDEILDYLREDKV